MTADTTRSPRAHDCSDCGRTYLTTESLREASCPDCGSTDWTTQMRPMVVPTWGPSVFFSPNADANGALHNLDLEDYGGPDHGGMTAGEMPSDQQIDDELARARARRSLVDERGGGM